MVIAFPKVPRTVAVFYCNGKFWRAKDIRHLDYLPENEKCRGSSPPASFCYKTKRRKAPASRGVCGCGYLPCLFRSVRISLYISINNAAWLRSSSDAVDGTANHLANSRSTDSRVIGLPFGHSFMIVFLLRTLPVRSALLTAHPRRTSDDAPGLEVRRHLIVLVPQSVGGLWSGYACRPSYRPTPGVLVLA